MANKNAKHKKNVPGAWYCTDPDEENGEGCIACNICYSSAPAFFAEDENGNAYVRKQPENDVDKELCQQQIDACPVSAIGNDG